MAHKAVAPGPGAYKLKPALGRPSSIQAVTCYIACKEMAGYLQYLRCVVSSN